jgi:hypothetical protein
MIHENPEVNANSFESLSDDVSEGQQKKRSISNNAVMDAKKKKR